MMKRFFAAAPGAVFRSLVFGTAWAAALASAAPAPEKLLPPDTILMLSAPSVPKFLEIQARSPQLKLWQDPAMKPFVDKFMNKWREEFVEPLERELKVRFADYSGLAQGQFTVGLTLPGGFDNPKQPPGLLVLLDSGNRSEQLKTNLANLRTKWTDAGRRIRTEKIREFEFNIITLSTNDVPATVRKFFPRPLEYHELGEEKEQEQEPPEVVIGQTGSFLVVASSLAAAEDAINRLTGGSTPSLGDQAAFTSQQSMFRDAPFYAWLNTKSLFDLMVKAESEKKENPEAPNPLQSIKLDRVFSALGLMGLRSASFSMREIDGGIQAEGFLSVPESSRTGLFKIIAGEAKETAAPPFVPADVASFQRIRVDGQKVWATLEKMMAEISPQSVNFLKFMLDTADMAAKQKDPDFDVRQNLIGNLGDDLILIEKAPAVAKKELEAGPVLVLLGSPRAEQLASAMRSVLVFLTAQAGAPGEREFLGRKLYSVPLPTTVFSAGHDASSESSPKTLHYAASGAYVAFSTESGMLEDYLRSGETPAKSLRLTPGLTEASQHVTGPGTSYFSYQNQSQSVRTLFETLRSNPSEATNSTSLAVLSGLPGMAKPERSIQEWMDFSLLPRFDAVSKYFHYVVTGVGANVQGITYKVYAPVPPELK
jgi:hypothetical protein